MAKFYSISGMSHGQSGGTGEKPQGPSLEDLQRRHPEFYKNRPEVTTAKFADVGDRFKFRGDEAEVKHVERNRDGSQEMIVQRSTTLGSGTYAVKATPDKQRRLVLTETKRTFD